MNPQLSWLTTVCLHGFDRNVPHLMIAVPPVFPLHQCLQCTVKNERKQISISNHHSQFPRWCAFNFAQVLFRCVLVPSNSAIKAKFKKNLYAKSIDFQKKKKNLFTSWIQACNLNASQLLYPLSYLCCGFRCIFAQVFSTSSSPTRCRMPADHHIPLSDKFKVGG